MRRQAALLAALLMMLAIAIPAHAQQGEDLREAAQNPIADLISVPFQNNTNFDIGHTDNAQNILNIQPVYPTHLNANWNLITRPILPVIDQPPFLSGPELRAAEQVVGPEIGKTEFGLGDLTPEFFFSPRKPVMLASDLSMVWGVGPAFQFPTATDRIRFIDATFPDGPRDTATYQSRLMGRRAQKPILGVRGFWGNSADTQHEIFRQKNISVTPPCGSRTHCV
jgi:hypothetical protein